MEGGGGAAGLEKPANVVKSRLSKPLFSPAICQGEPLRPRTGEKPLKNGGKQAQNGEIPD